MLCRIHTDANNTKIRKKLLFTAQSISNKIDIFFIANLSIPGDVRTTIKSGSRFNVTWHLGYPHQGGYRLELLDPNEKKLLDLTHNGDGFVGQEDTT